MTYEEERESSSFKIIEDEPIILDFKSCTHIYDIHLVLKEKLGFPEYYGMNWDALRDCLDHLFQRDVTIEIHNFNSLTNKLKSDCKPMFDVFNDIHADTPNVTFTIVS